MRLHYVISLAILFLSMLPAKAATQEDSLTIATATLWNGQLKAQVTRNFGNDSVAIDKFIKGIAQAFSTPQDDAPYYSGLLQGLVLVQRFEQMKAMGLKINPLTFCQSLAQQINGNPSLFSNEEANNYLNSYIASLSKPDTVSLASEQAFIDKQLHRKNVVKTASGLVFETITDGTGNHPKTSDKVKLLYIGRLSDGTVFDLTEEPVIFDVSHLVAGFTEGLQLMKPGGRYRLFIPSELGYGKRGINGIIPGNSTLDFEVNLIEIITK